MDMVKVFHMNKGEDEASYAKNCYVQKQILSLTKSFIEEGIRSYLEENEYPETIGIADLGCSSGPTALKAVSEMIDVVSKTYDDDDSSSPKFMVFLNDLPGNDFNGVFASLANFQNKLKQVCYVAGLPGSFYGRLLPPNTLHFVHSSSSLHWLSQVPSGLNGENNKKAVMVNKGKIYVSVSSPREVINAYINQFRKDFLSFLGCRAEEVISGGRMVFTLMGRKSIDPTCLQGSYQWDFISQCLMTLVQEGLIEEEKVDSFNVPYYAPCLEEIKELVEQESSFYGHRFEAVQVEWDGGFNNYTVEDPTSSFLVLTKGQRISKMHRAVTESMFEHYFGGDILDHLFHSYARVWDHHLTHNPDSQLITLVVSLIRN